MRVLIVDKEPDERSALAYDLAKRTDIEAFDSAENILEHSISCKQKSMTHSPYSSGAFAASPPLALG